MLVLFTRRLVGLLCVSVLVLATLTGAHGIELVPHRALYTMKLVSVEQGSDVISASGTMLYSLRDDCGGWASETRVKLRLSYMEGSDAYTVWSFASWEAKDGLSYRFRIAHERDGRKVENLHGMVTRAAVDEAAEARFGEPEGTVVRLPAGTLFPSRHLVEMLAAAEAGQVMFRKTFFDGADLDNPYEVNAVITDSPKAAADDTALSAISRAGFADMSTRSMHMAFFPVHSRAAVPDFELISRYRPDGIAPSVRQDLGDFVLDLALDEIEALPPAPC